MDFFGFFSYAHADSRTDESTFDSLSDELEARVQQQLVNASFSLWRDSKSLRVSDKWSNELEKAVNNADVFIGTISPSWINSVICRHEYNTFLSKEKELGENFPPSIVPIIIRSIGGQEKHLNDLQTEIFADINSRQYTRKYILDFKTMSHADRSVWIDKVADDVVGVIEKIRSLRTEDNNNNNIASIRFSKSEPKKEFSYQAYNFEEVDFIGDCDLIIRSTEESVAHLYGQFDFIERLYVNTEIGRVDFGVRRAMLIVQDQQGYIPKPSNHIRNSSPNVRYLRMHEFPNALTVSIDPPTGRTALSELALPPGPAATDNRSAELASFSNEQDIELTATLTVNLNTEGVFINNQKELNHSNTEIAKLEAILAVAAEKYAGASDGAIKRRIEVRDERAIG